PADPVDVAVWPDQQAAHVGRWDEVDQARGVEASLHGLAPRYPHYPQPGFDSLAGVPSAGGVAQPNASPGLGIGPEPQLRLRHFGILLAVWPEVDSPDAEEAVIGRLDAGDHRCEQPRHAGVLDARVEPKAGEIGGEGNAPARE